jgi:hypothetical protein
MSDPLFTTNVYIQDLVFTSAGLRSQLALQQGCGGRASGWYFGDVSAPSLRPCSLCPSALNVGNPIGGTDRSFVQSPW